MDSLWNYIDNVCQPIPKSRLTPHCVLYSTKWDRLECDKCDFGFQDPFLNDGDCIPLEDPLCATGDWHDCESCFDQHVLNPATKKCDPQQQCKTENCNVCRNDNYPGYGSCLLCNEGFSLFYDNFVKTLNCVKSTDNCFQTQNDSKLCQTCNVGYYITSESTCSKIPDSEERIQIVSRSYPDHVSLKKVLAGQALQM